ncbi:MULTISPECIES: tripartite tricarboxylate transporter TctB family protein [Dickeya]|uniref:tripartite tricarboxylate transporter TctB family protein n=1 Tax=Dickeya TaxID=204037 RepID=UPI00039E46BE|nr:MULTISPECIES: tripartite tricarboxylate transporter TctB family protein [Dickeya]WKV50348.1 tripartite tricarboxylate transporter TctB family protein [Dickeya fangzhongdai]
MSDRLFAGIWLALCLIGLVIGWEIQSEYSYEPVGPRPFPLAMLGLMALCAALLLLRKPDTLVWPSPPVCRRLSLLVVMLTLYAWLFESLGFPLATALLGCGIGMLFGAVWWMAALSGAVMGVSLFYAFDKLLDVTLPAGAWF